MSLLDIVEGILGTVSDIQLDVVNDLFGLVVDVYEAETSVAESVYGNYIGDQTTPTPTRQQSILVSGEVFQFFTQSSSDIGTMTEVTVYLKSSQSLKEGSKLKITRNDGRTFSFLVKKNVSLGVTTKIISRYVIAYIEE